MAYVIEGSGEEGPQVTFCPDFFIRQLSNRPKTLGELAKEPKKSRITGLMSYRQIVLHEFMARPHRLSSSSCNGTFWACVAN